MAIDAEDLLAPVGALTPELLDALRTLVSGATTAAAVADEYAAAGAAKTAAWTDAARADQGAVAWATYRALMDRAQQILAQAMSGSAEGEGSEGWSTSQAVELKKDAATWLATYEGLEAAEAAASAGTAPPATSHTTRHVFAW